MTFEHVLIRTSDVSRPSILIFSNLSERDGIGLLRGAATCLQEEKIQIKNVIITTYNERRNGQARIGNYRFKCSRYPSD
jgi:hypothetical protein